MSKQGKRSTIYDIAQAAGVSYQTVSRVINNSPHVSALTRHRVQEAIQRLDYSPNKAAQVLNTQRSNLIELIILDAFTPAPTIDTVSRIATSQGYKLIISFIRDGSLEATINEALGRSVDGFMLTTSSANIDDKALRALFKRAPFVRLVAEYGVSVPSVLYDQRHGEAQAARHLIELGHREIAEISGAPTNIDSIARHNGLITTLHEFGLEPAAQAAGNFSIESGYAAAQVLFESGRTFTAIAAANDEMAMGAMAYMRQRGLRVPQDMSVIGFDDHPFAPYADPPLTTLRQDWNMIARVATEYLVDLIEQPDTPHYQHVLQPELIVRESTRRLV